MILSKTQQRERRHRRVRATVIGSETRPRLSIYKSNTRVVAQIIDDEKGITLAAVSSTEAKGKTPRERAEAAAQMLAKKAPFQGSSAQEVLQQHVSAPVPPLPRSQDDFQALIDVLLAKDPDARPASAEATLKLIDRLFYE